MVYVVERYLPGLSRTDLLRRLSALEHAAELPGGPIVRYLGSTIVLEDEACFCQFEASSEAAVAEVNRRAGLSFARIVPAITVEPTERSNPMNVSAHQATVKPGWTRLYGLIAAVAIAAVAVWAIVSYAGGTDSHSAKNSVPTQAAVLASLSPKERQYVEGIMALTTRQIAAGFGTGFGSALASLTPSERRYVLGIASMTSAQQAAAFGADVKEGAVLASLSPKERQYVEGIMALTTRQIAAGFGTGRWAVSTFAVGTSSKQSVSVSTTAAAHRAVASGNREAVIMSLTPASLVPGAFGGYALPSLQHGPTTQSVLVSMSPATRRYTKMIMSLTFGQLKAGAAGAP